MKKSGYDVIIIGGGQAGIPLAHALAAAGKQVALIERENLGGSCVNFGCTPTKAAIASARVAHLARRATEFGLRVSQVEVDFPAVLERAKSIALESRTSLENDLKETGNPQLIRGQAKLTGKNEQNLFQIQVGADVLTAKQVVLNTGTRSVIPKIEGLEKVKFIDAGNWLENKELPAHLVIIGGSYIGLEMCQFYRRMGSRVTVIEGSPRIASREDEDVSEALQTILEGEGIDFCLSAKVFRVESKNGGIVVTIDEKSDSQTIAASHLFIAVGRKPNTDDLGLESVGVKMDERGIVGVDERLATNIEGVWAAGDIRGGFQFTHTAWDDYRILESQMVGDKSRTTKRIVPYAMFTDPELGRVGMTEKEARENGVDFKISRYEMKSNGKAREIGESVGFIKVLSDAKTEKIIGAAVLANEGAELVHGYVDLMNADASFIVLRDAVHIHPTLAEAVQSAVKSL
ncbi:MAG: mercuric reductase [Pyrinomonadaceae bacterium]|nr:mercuric reductase [Pyrinomonadaceae bacterium]